jgi:DNA-binding response OmpR family regulator
MPEKDMPQVDAVVIEPSESLGRDLQIYLARRCGLVAEHRRQIDGYDPAEAPAAPKLLVTSGLGDGSGLALVRRVRTLGLPTFVLYIDRRGSPDEGGDAFASGADDVIRVPFTLREFGLRLRTRLGPEFVTESPAAGLVPELMLDADNRLLAAASPAVVQMTPAEAEIMAVLIRRGGLLVTRNDLSRAIDKCEWVYGDRKFDVHITRIRRKLQKAFGDRYVVQSVRAEGYTLTETPATPVETCATGPADWA